MRRSRVGIPELQLAVDPLGGSLEKSLYERGAFMRIAHLDHLVNLVRTGFADHLVNNQPPREITWWGRSLRMAMPMIGMRRRYLSSWP